MIGLQFKRADGTYARADMAQLKKLADGISQIHKNWSGTLVYCKEFDCFIELSEAPADIRGNSEGAAVEVDENYARSVYGLSNL